MEAQEAKEANEVPKKGRRQIPQWQEPLGWTDRMLLRVVPVAWATGPAAGGAGLHSFSRFPAWLFPCFLVLRPAAGLLQRMSFAGERTFFGRVGLNLLGEQGAQGDPEVEAAATAVHNSGDAYHFPAFLTHYLHGLARGSAGGEDILSHQHSLAGGQGKAAKSEAPGGIPFHKYRAGTELPRQLVAQDYAAQRRRRHYVDLHVSEAVGQGVGEAGGVRRVLEEQRALDVKRAVQAGGELEVAVADGARGFEQQLNLFLFHAQTLIRRRGRMYHRDSPTSRRASRPLGGPGAPRPRPLASAGQARDRLRTASGREGPSPSPTPERGWGAGLGAFLGPRCLR